MAVDRWVGEAVRPAFAASNAGINALTRHSASAYGKDGIRANSVSPGGALSETAIAMMSEEFEAQLVAGVTIGRLGNPQDLVQSICFLSGDDAGWVSGQVWSVNAGAGFRDRRAAVESSLPSWCRVIPFP